MSERAAAMAGLYGKIPSKADFVHRNLPASFVRPWDEWLSRCLSTSRARLAGGWTERYLSGPVWRFALEPGLLGAEAWGGALATSVDAVNRFFPLTIAVPVGSDFTMAEANARLEPWLPRLEDMALDLIEGVLDLDGAVGEAREIARSILRREDRAAGYVWRDPDGAQRGWLTLAQGMPSPPVPTGRPGGASAPLSCWWRAPWHGEPAASLACAGLPPAEFFVGFLDGQWFEHGWQALVPGEVAQ